MMRARSNLDMVRNDQNENLAIVRYKGESAARLVHQVNKDVNQAMANVSKEKRELS